MRGVYVCVRYAYCLVHDIIQSYNIMSTAISRTPINHRKEGVALHHSSRFSRAIFGYRLNNQPLPKHKTCTPHARSCRNSQKSITQHMPIANWAKWLGFDFTFHIQDVFHTYISYYILHIRFYLPPRRPRQQAATAPRHLVFCSAAQWQRPRSAVWVRCVLSSQA